MQRSSVIGVVALVIIVGAGVWYVAGHPARQVAIMLSASALPAQSPYVEHAQGYDIFVNYATSTPLVGEANTAALVLMRNYLGDAVAEFKNGSSPDRTRKETLQITYLIASSAHTISYIFTTYEDTLGAHGNTFFHTFTFNTSTGASLALADIFTPGAPYLDTLSSTSRARLPGILGDSADADFIKNGTTPEDRNFANFFFDNRDFVILFAPYAVAPYSAGPQTLRIQLPELFSILKLEYR